MKTLLEKKYVEAFNWLGIAYLDTMTYYGDLNPKK